MPQSINHSRRDFRNKLPLHTDYPVIVCYGICCSFPCTIWYLLASENKEHRSPPALQFLLGALPVFKRQAEESAPAQAGTGSCVAIPNPPSQATNTSLEATRLSEVPSSSQQALLECPTACI